MQYRNIRLGLWQWTNSETPQRSDVSSQPEFRYIRDVIAKAIDVDMGEFSIQLQDESVRRKHVPQAEKHRCGWYLADSRLCFAAYLGVGECICLFIFTFASSSSRYAGSQTFTRCHGRLPEKLPRR